jgi:hypothetical protein
VDKKFLLAAEDLDVSLGQPLDFGVDSVYSAFSVLGHAACQIDLAASKKFALETVEVRRAPPSEQPPHSN